MRKRLFVLAATALMLISAPTAAKAEVYSGGSDWKVEFNGSQLNSTFKSSDINDAIYKLQPGDSVNISVSLVNSYEGETDWYMTNEVLQSLEDSQSVAGGGAYAYILTYINPEGQEKLLYSSESVGGEGSNVAGEGLHQATNNLKNYFYLDYLTKGESAQVKLTVALDGETQGNTYQDTLAKLQMNFAVEPTSTDAPSGYSRTNRPTVSEAGIVQTGDNIRNLIFSAVTLVAGIFFVVLAVRKNKQEKGAE